jgi:non-ribosomal peptide synthetase component F
LVTADRLEQLKKLSPAQKAHLVQALRERRATATAPVETGIPRRAGTGPAPLSSGQRRMWLAQQMDPESPAANLLAPLRLDGALDVRALAAALTEVARRHEVLRTGIEAPDGEPVPAVMPPRPLLVPIVDLAGLPDPLAEEESLRLAAAEARLPFDLSRPPVLRTKLVRTAAGSHLLLLTLHHVAADGWSIGVLMREVVALYGAFAAGLPSPLPELPIQYADYAAWQQDRLAAGDLAGDLAYWRQRLSGLAPLELPRRTAFGSRAVRPSLLLPESLIERMQELARQERATLFMAFAAAFGAFLGRLAERDDVAFATPVAGRVREETEGLIGFFVNTLVLRVDLGGNPTFRRLLERLRTTVGEAYAHQDLPFERLVEELAPERRPGRHPLVQSLLAFQNAPRDVLSVPGLTVTWVEVRTSGALFVLALEVEPLE